MRWLVACFCELPILGKTSAANIPTIAITTISSIKLKPDSERTRLHNDPCTFERLHLETEPLRPQTWLQVFRLLYRRKTLLSIHGQYGVLHDLFVRLRSLKEGPCPEPLSDLCYLCSDGALCANQLKESQKGIEKGMEI